MSKQLIIEEIAPLSELHKITPSRDMLHAQHLAEHRQKEWLSWRAIVRRECGAEVEIAYDKAGAPYIVGSTLHLSVSHTRTHVAVLLSEVPCAVDMELLSRNFSAVRGRYISEAEQQIIDSTQLSMAIAWCAKEAAYKLAHTSALDFTRDITITKLSHATQHLEVNIRGNIATGEYQLFDGYVVVVVR